MTDVKNESVVAIFTDHNAAEAAVKKLAAAHFVLKTLSVVGQGYQTEENVVGFYNAGDRMKFWGTRGAFWGALWTMFFGGCLCRCGYLPGLNLGRKMLYDHFGRANPWSSAAS